MKIKLIRTGGFLPISKESEADVKNLTISQAEKMFGINSSESKAVRQGWDEAKV